MTKPFNRPVPLTKDHDVDGFDCGKQPLNDFLKKYAMQNQKGGGARTYVTARESRVIGYYSLAPSSIELEDADERILKGQANYQIPAILMARFAVDRSEQGKGLGTVLFRDALMRSLEGEAIIGGRAFLVHAKDEEAYRFYKKFGMMESPINPFHLMLLFKDVRAMLA